MLFTDLSSERLIRALHKAGFRVIQEGKHVGLSDGFHRLTIPRHKRLNPYTVKAIIRHAGLTDHQFQELL
ncbi:MAG TPA: type II toxin-antitoxin system HicA family toxin [Elusimicrobiota bacterium]|nr:type II toxin-antitoxin system HicA family toxin [Elusimicrobiota bacterium]